MAEPFSEEIKQQWKEIISRQRQSKLSIAAWCRQNGTAVHTFYYWQGKLFPKSPLSRSIFTEAVDEASKPSTEIILKYQEFNIHLNEHFNSSALKRCLEVLKTC
jgi:hypothetical protein